MLPDSPAVFPGVLKIAWRSCFAQILVDTVVLANLERYSSQVQNFLLLGSKAYPTEHWDLLGNFTAANAYGDQTFELPTPAWARYIKLRYRVTRISVLHYVFHACDVLVWGARSMKTHYGNEFYCTLSSFQIFGITIMDELHSAVHGANIAASMSIPVEINGTAGTGDDVLSSFTDELTRSLDSLDSVLLGDGGSLAGDSIIPFTLSIESKDDVEAVVDVPALVGFASELAAASELLAVNTSIAASNVTKAPPSAEVDVGVVDSDAGVNATGSSAHSQSPPSVDGVGIVDVSSSSATPVGSSQEASLAASKASTPTFTPSATTSASPPPDITKPKAAATSSSATASPMPTATATPLSDSPSATKAASTSSAASATAASASTSADAKSSASSEATASASASTSTTASATQGRNGTAPASQAIQVDVPTDDVTKATVAAPVSSQTPPTNATVNGTAATPNTTVLSAPEECYDSDLVVGDGEEVDMAELQAAAASIANSNSAAVLVSAGPHPSRMPTLPPARAVIPPVPSNGKSQTVLSYISKQSTC